MSVLIPVSIGELYDKITILEIKVDRLSTSSKKRQYAVKELALLNACAKKKIKTESRDSLKAVNEALWEAEDKIREKEKKSCFDADFVAIARSIYKLNDKRAEIKLAINLELGSTIIEVKSY